MKQQQLEAKINEAITYLITGILIDGAHHKQWYLDKALFILLGEEEYLTRFHDYGWGMGRWHNALTT